MKRLLLVGAGAAVLAAGALVVFLLTFDLDRYRGELTALVADRTGREFRIDGGIAFAPSLVPTIVIEGIHLGNAGWAHAPALLSAGRLEATVALVPLLRQRLEIRHIGLERLEIALERDAQGRRNWELQPRAPQAGPRRIDLPAFEVRAIAVRDATIRYRDQAGPAAERVARIDQFESNTPGAAAPLAIALAATLDDRRLAVRGTIGPIQTLLADAPYTLDLVAAVDEAQASVKGRIGQPLAFTGLDLAVALSAPALDALAPGHPPVGPVTLNAGIADHAGGFALTDLRARIGRSRIEGEVALTLTGERPRVDTTLEAALIDLTPFQPPPVPDAAKGARVFSAEPLPLAWLRAADAAIRVHAGELHTRQAVLNDLQAQVALAAGRLRIDPLRAHVAGGRLEGRIALDGAGEQPALDLVAEARELMPGQFPALAAKGRVEGGATDLSLALRGAGASVAAIMAGAHGHVRVKVGPGTLVNKAAGLAGADALFDGLRLLNPLAGSDPRTRIECAVINFPIDNGIAASETGIALQTDKLNILGGGTIDLRSERIDIGARPKPRQGIGLNLAGLGDFVRLGGTLADPRPVTDAGGAATAGLKVGAAVATGGLSILAEGLFDRVTVDDTVCAVAAGEQPLQATGQPAADTDQSVVEKAAGRTRDTVKRAGDTVRGVFKGLFGD